MSEKLFILNFNYTMISIPKIKLVLMRQCYLHLTLWKPDKQLKVI